VETSGLEADRYPAIHIQISHERCQIRDRTDSWGLPIISTDVDFSIHGRLTFIRFSHETVVVGGLYWAQGTIDCIGYQNMSVEFPIYVAVTCIASI
jgi:hypothetical protein